MILQKSGYRLSGKPKNPVPPGQRPAMVKAHMVVPCSSAAPGSEWEKRAWVFDYFGEIVSTVDERVAWKGYHCSSLFDTRKRWCRKEAPTEEVKQKRYIKCKHLVLSALYAFVVLYYAS